MSTLIPRQVWLINRVQQCVNELEEFKDNFTWEEYMQKSKKIAQELLYACTEWEKYYKDSESK